MVVRLSVNWLAHLRLSIGGLAPEVGGLIVDGLSIGLLCVGLPVVVEWLSVDGLLGISWDDDVIDRGIGVIHIVDSQLFLESFLLLFAVAVAGDDDNDGHTDACPHNCAGNGPSTVGVGVIVIAVIGVAGTVAVVITAVVVAVLVVAVRVVAHKIINIKGFYRLDINELDGRKYG